MLCDICHQQDAMIHVQEVRPDGTKTLRLCLPCALKRLTGLAPDGMGHFGKTLENMMSMMQQFNPLQGTEEMPESIREALSADQHECPNCHMKRGDFLRKHMLGCPKCAETFADILQDFLRSSTPSALPLPNDVPDPQHCSPEQLRDHEINRLRNELTLAIKAENYERAASLRDLLAEFEPSETEETE